MQSFGDIVFSTHPGTMNPVGTLFRWFPMTRTVFLSCLLFVLILPFLGAEEQPWLIESKGLTDPPKRERMLWADSVQYKSIDEICGEPIIEVERWVNEPPKDLTGKFVLIEVWATW